MKYKNEQQKIIVEILANNKGKFRFKTRENTSNFGKTFSTRGLGFDKTSYLEWQIGYDATGKDLKNGKKKTQLTQRTFVGANGQKKYPYELSELLHLATKTGLIEKMELKKLLSEIGGYKKFLGDEEIEIEHNGSISINELAFEKASIRLPTFFLRSENDIQIEVSIQKQQYATGVQPMLYLAIPLHAFKNGSDFHGRSSKRGEVLLYEINKDNAKLLLLVFKVFAMCSLAHLHDTKEILKILIAD